MATRIKSKPAHTLHKQALSCIFEDHSDEVPNSAKVVVQLRGETFAISNVDFVKTRGDNDGLFVLRIEGDPLLPGENGMPKAFTIDELEQFKQLFTQENGVTGEDSF